MAGDIKRGGKIFLALFIAGILFAVGYFTNILDMIGPKPVRVQIVTYAGMAGGPYYNNGLEPNAESRFKKEQGLDVKFSITDDVMAAREDLLTNNYDVVVLTVDGMAPGIDNFIKEGPVVFGETDISQGADVAVAAADIQKWSDLKNYHGRKGRVGIAQFTPSQFAHYINMQAADMNWNDVDVVFFEKVPQVVEAMMTGKIDVAWVWAPDDQTIYEKVKGSHPLWSTKDGNQMLFGIMYTTRKYHDSHQKELTKLMTGWMIGNAEINNSPAARKKAATIMSAAFQGIPEDFWLMSFDNVRLATLGDQQNLFGLNTTYNGVTAERIYVQSAKMYQDLKILPEGNIPSWRDISDTKVIKAINLTGSDNAAQKLPEFSPPTPEVVNKAPIATKPIHINFATNSSTLDIVAKAELDKFADVMKMNRGARFRFDGYTDATGDRKYNITLSEARAQAAARYFMDEYGFKKNQLIVEGHGPDNPIADNGTENGRWQNRRTEIGIVIE